MVAILILNILLLFNNHNNTKINFTKPLTNTENRVIFAKKDRDKSLIEAISAYFATQPVLKAWLFSSYARGEQTDASDVDILVVFDEQAHVGLFRYAHIMNELEDLLNKKVDLVVDGTLLPFAVESVEQDKKLIYERAS